MRAWTPLRLGSVVLVFASSFPTALRSQDDPWRFHAVPEWRGSLRLTGHGTGTLPISPGSMYEVDVSADLPLILKGSAAGAPIQVSWTGCVANYVAHLDSTLRTFCESGMTEFTTTASGPFLDVGHGECPPISISITPPPFSTGTATLSLPLLGFDATERIKSDCPDTDETFRVPVGVFPLKSDDLLSSIPLPESGLRIEASWEFEDIYDNPMWNGPIDWKLVLVLAGEPIEDELVVEPLESYPSWLPEGGQSEDDPGNEIAFVAKLQKQGGGLPSSRVRSFRFELVDTSAVPGVCMNFPAPESAPISQPDLQFTPEMNGAPWKAFAGHGQTIETEDGEYTSSPAAVLTSFDWGGTTTLRVSAILTDDTVIFGYLEGDPGTTEIPIPKREEGSRIADAWKLDHGVSGLDDADDDESAPPGDGHGGDGLSLYEEYRGFYLGDENKHVTGDPQVKDLFVQNELGTSLGVRLYEGATGVRVHDEVKPGQLDEDRVINFQHAGDSTHRVDQHALILKRSDLADGVHGKAAGGPGLPKDVHEIRINASLDLAETMGVIQNGEFSIASSGNTTIAHELLHASNVYHHGRGDIRKKVWTVAQEGDDLVFKDEDGRTASLLTESGQMVRPASMAPLKTYMGVDGGEASGDDRCILRYPFARAYRDRSFTGFPYYYYILDTETEPPGSIVCSGRDGVGVNDPDREPQPRYGSATAGCCTHQICINDAMSHAPGTDPVSSGCDAGRGFEDGDLATLARRREGAGQGIAPPSPHVALAVNDSTIARLVSGWPLLVAVELTHPGAFEPTGEITPITISPPQESWGASVRIAVRNSQGGVEAWPLRAAGDLQPELVLDASRGGLAAFWLAPEDSAAIAPGTYEIVATLDTSDATEGWIGAADAPRATLTVLDPTSPQAADLEGEGLLLRTRYHFFHGELRSALSALGELLADDPAHPVALAYRANIIAAEGDKEQALDLYTQAIDIVLAADPDSAEPPAELIRLHGELQAEIVRETLLGETLFVRGDVNADARLDLTDAVVTLNHLFTGGATPTCLESADANGDGRLDISDPIRALGYLFLGAGPPPAPFPDCGVAESSVLGCATFPPCDR